MIKQIALVEVWLGKIPDYFQYHIETIGSLSCVDFYFFTDDKSYDFSEITHKNFHLNYINESEFLNRFNKVSKVKIGKINNPKKIIDFKLSYFEMFSDYVNSYPYVGVYDVDTMFGDMNQTLLDCINDYDFISVGDEVFHNRLSGPLFIVRNTSEFHDLMKTDRYYETLLMDDIYGYGEQELSVIAHNNYKVKILHSMNTDTKNGGKTTYDVCWKGGKLYSGDEEKLIYHFYRKGHTTFQKVGNQIYARYDKKFLNDFFWVFGFTENYSETVPHLMDSINKYSNRKCIIYTINFDYNIPQKFLTSEQFIFRRIEIEEGHKDYRGRDENIISCKPKLMIDVVTQYPDDRFIFIDSDIYLTTSADDLCKHFNELTTYPLINSHIHDVVYHSGIIEGEKWTSTAHILAKKIDVDICVFPRRKTNVMLFDNRSKWFFKEQIDVYEKYKNTEKGIFALHDEDSANVILSKYNLYGCIPLSDIEDCSDIKLETITDLNNPFHMTQISPSVRLPQTVNDIAVFHGMKDIIKFQEIEENYGKNVLDCEEILTYYKDNTIFFEKNSFLSTKTLSGEFDFIVKNKDGVILQQLLNQSLMKYWIFYISNVHLDKGDYIIEIIKTSDKQKVYNNLISV
jgi:hypothetical protein